MVFGKLNVLFLLILLFLCNACAEGNEDVIEIVFTSNLNGAIEDCQCGGDTVGGFDRILAQLKNIRTQNPNTILLDTGDMLTSYSLPAANQAMLKMLWLAKYDALNLGDQEFVESVDFLKENTIDKQAELPFLSANLFLEEPEKIPLIRSQEISYQEFKIVILGLVNKETFHFIQPSGMQFKAAGEVLTAASAAAEENDFHVLLYHGDWESARKLAADFSWLNLILLGNNQESRFEYVGKTALAECGGDGELLGKISAKKEADSWRFTHEFLPIMESLPISPEAMMIVEEYYRQIRLND